MESRVHTKGDSQMRLREAFSRFGGNLTFRLTFNNEGWLAECNEIPGLFTGTPNPSPTFVEIDELVRDAIFAAFDINQDEALQLKRIVHTELGKSSVNITQSPLRINELVAVLGKTPELAHA